jgi:hypothetical protein
MKTIPCILAQAGDRSWCDTCGLVWDMNDTHEPPPCPNRVKRDVGPSAVILLMLGGLSGAAVTALVFLLLGYGT